MNLQLGIITSAERVPNSNRLYKLTVLCCNPDKSYPKELTIVKDCEPSTTAEDLIDKCVAIDTEYIRNIRGIKSYGRIYPMF